MYNRVFHRCHQNTAGARLACCENQDPPSKLKNVHNFPAKYVNAAAKLINTWFMCEDDDINAMCRVTRMGGAENCIGKYEPVMYYTHVDTDGGIVENSSSLPEVKEWVRADKTNL